MSSLVNYLARVNQDHLMPRDSPRKSKKYPRMPVVVLSSGSHTGGNCDECNRPLGYWLDKPLCDVCLDIPSNAVTSRGVFLDE